MFYYEKLTPITFNATFNGVESAKNVMFQSMKLCVESVKNVVFNFVPKIEVEFSSINTCAS